METCLKRKIKCRQKSLETSFTHNWSVVDIAHFEGRHAELFNWIAGSLHFIFSRGRANVCFSEALRLSPQSDPGSPAQIAFLNRTHFRFDSDTPTDKIIDHPLYHIIPRLWIPNWRTAHRAISGSLPPHELRININEKLLWIEVWYGLFCWLVVIQWRHAPAVGGKSWRNSGKRPLGWMTHAQKSMHMN